MKRTIFALLTTLMIASAAQASPITRETWGIGLGYGVASGSGIAIRKYFQDNFMAQVNFFVVPGFLLIDSGYGDVGITGVKYFLLQHDRESLFAARAVAATSFNFYAPFYHHNDNAYKSQSFATVLGVGAGLEYFIDHFSISLDLMLNFPLYFYDSGSSYGPFLSPQLSLIYNF